MWKMEFNALHNFFFSAARIVALKNISKPVAL